MKPNLFYIDPSNVDFLPPESGKEKPFNTWWMDLAHIPMIWKYSLGEHIKVAILDSGIGHHPELKGAIKEKVNFTDEDHYADNNGHGTYIAGIIGARNTSSFIGIAPECAIYSAKVLRESNSSTMDFIINGLNWALEKGVDHDRHDPKE